ncbi:MAG: hypothetical protein JWQ48_2571 [Conexibacter sp.]|nr:hypothetical protein [Conexibacter sp.]
MLPAASVRHDADRRLLRARDAIDRDCDWRSRQLPRGGWRS